MVQELTLEESTANPDSGVPRSGVEARARIAEFSGRIATETLTVDALVDTLKGAKKFIEQAAREYEERFLLELIQNAYDAHPRGSLGTVSILLDTAEGEHGTLYMANTGTPFTDRDFRSICEIAQSSKRPGQGIGNKGVGFKSVLQVSEWPEIYSASSTPSDCFDGYCFTFARSDDLLKLANGDVADAAKLDDRLSRYFLPIAIGSQSDTVRSFARAGFASVVRLPLRTERAAVLARDQLAIVQANDAPLLLFLDRLATLRIEVREPGAPPTSRELHRRVSVLSERDDSGVELSEVDLAPAGRYLLATKEVERDRFVASIKASIEAKLVDEAWGEWDGEAAVGVALRLDGGGEGAPEERLYCYLPMGADARSPIPGHIHGPFAVTLSRSALVPGTPVNDLLFDAAAQVCAVAALRLQSHSSARTLIPDLITWQDKYAERIVRAFSALGTSIVDAPVVPIVGTHPWGSFRKASRWLSGYAVLSPARIAEGTGAEIVEPSLGENRLGRLAMMAAHLPNCAFDPTLEIVATWTATIAEKMASAARREPAAFDAASWVDLYDDLARHFGWGEVAALRGRRILIDDRFHLHPTWGGREDDRGPAIFFRRRESAEGADAPHDISIPQTLAQHLAYLHADLPWRVLNDQTPRRLVNRPGRDFLERTGLVRPAETAELLERISKVLARRREKQLHADALRLVYNLTAARGPSADQSLDTLNLRVPTLSGEWRPASETRFSDAWRGTHGSELVRLIHQAAGASPDLESLKAGLLGPPSAFGFQLDSLERWVRTSG